MREPKDLAKHCANVLKVLCQPGRVKIIDFIRAEEKSVFDIAGAAGFEQSNASHHISKMYFLGILDSRKMGQMTLYRLKHQGSILALIDRAMQRPLLLAPPERIGPESRVIKSDDLAMYKLFGDVTRIRIIEELRGGEIYGGTLISRLGAAHYNLSRHMTPLKSAGIVSMRKEKAKTIYRLTDQDYTLSLVDLAKRVILQESRDTVQRFEQMG